MTGRRKKYGETARTAIVAALNIAAEKYEEDAEMATSGGTDGIVSPADANPRLAKQFEHQAKQARELAEEIEEFEVVEIS